MALNTLGALGAALFLVGCTAGPKVCDTADDSGSCDSGTDTADTSDTDDTEDTDLTFNVAWVAAGATLSISNGSGMGYSFGMAEQSAQGWYGEDCVDGAGPNSGDFDICHDGASTTGLTLDAVSVLREVVANETTLISVTIAEAGHVAYVLISNDDASCLQQNDADGYYASCIED